MEIFINLNPEISFNTAKIEASQKRMDCASLLVQSTLLAQLLVSRSTFDGKKLQGFHLKILCQVSFQSTRFVEEYGFEKYPRRIQFYFQS